MATNFPASLDVFEPVPRNQAVAVKHHDRHQNVEDAIEAIEAFVGVAGTGALAIAAAFPGKLASTTSGLGAALIGWPAGFGVQQLGTNTQFAQNGAGIWRVNDRMLVAGATLNDGALPNVGRDWMTDYWFAGGFSNGPIASTAFAVANNDASNQAISILGAAHSENFTSSGTTAIGVFGAAFNDNATLATKIYGGYFEAHRTTAAAADTYGLEIDTRTLKASVSPNPFQLGDVIGLQVASGAEWSASGQFDASAAIQIAPNPMKFKVGINIMATALVDTLGLKEAMMMPVGSLLSAWSATGRTNFIYMAATAPLNAAKLQMSNGSLSIGETSTGAEAFRANVASTYVNYPMTSGSVTTGAIQYGAEGTDANIDVQLTPKGTGNVRFGAFTANADAPVNGYVTIKDAAGNVRKLATIA